MEWIERMKACLDYVETHLEEKIQIEDLARIAYCSKFHFQRMFHMLTNVPISEYIRNRKLTMAAQDLSMGDSKVIDIAFKYGYETPESFSKAFYKLHGVNPSQVKKEGANLKAYPRIYFKLYIKGDKDMDYKIIKKDAFKVVGVKKRISTVDGENFKMIPAFWQENFQNGTVEQLKKFSTNDLTYGICTEFDQEANEFTYYIAVDFNHNMEIADYSVTEIPASTWAVFKIEGEMPQSMIDVWNRIYSEWFPSTNYEHGGTAELEVYYSNQEAEIWMPIVKK